MFDLVSQKINIQSKKLLGEASFNFMPGLLVGRDQTIHCHPENCNSFFCSSKWENNLYKEKYSVKGHLFNKNWPLGIWVSMKTCYMHVLVIQNVVAVQCACSVDPGPGALSLTFFFKCLQHENLGSNSQLKMLWCNLQVPHGGAAE